MKVKGFAASEKGKQAKLMGMAMASVIREERKRNARHLAALWVAVIITFIVAVL